MTQTFTPVIPRGLSPFVRRLYRTAQMRLLRELGFRVAAKRRSK